MAIDKTNITNCIQSTIDNANDTCETTDIFLMANSVDDNTTDRKDFVETDSDLPDLFSSNVPEGTIFYVKNLGVPVVASDNCWLGLDGRLFRNDTPAGEIYSWGRLICGVGGANDINTNCATPTQETTSSLNWTQVSTGIHTTLAIKKDGTLWGWGYNGSDLSVVGGGQLGDGTTICRSSPVQEVSSSTDWCYVSSGGLISNAIKTNGTLWSWGSGSCFICGALAKNNNLDYSSPVQEVSSSTNWCKSSINKHFIFYSGVGSASDCYRPHVNAIKTDGTLWSWGCNFAGQIGDGTTIDRSSPVQEVSSSTSWCDVNSNGNSSSGIKTNGSLWSWGSNNSGRLGDGTIFSRSSPVQEVSSSTNWCQVSRGSTNTSAIKNDGTLWAWGNNNCGAIGVGAAPCCTTCFISPVQEACSSTNWREVSVGFDTMVALKTDSTLWGWGCSQSCVLQIDSNTPREYSNRTVTGKPYQCISFGFTHVVGLTST